jgi:cytochrome c
MASAVSALAAGATVLALLSSGAAAQPGDAARGSAVFDSYCSDCHGLVGVRMGPSLKGVVGRRAASLPGYPYSAALAAANLIWTPVNLDRFLAGPRELVPGTSMEALHLSARDRQDVIAYLRTLRP